MLTLTGDPATDITESPVEFQVYSDEPAELTVNWGDGTVETYVLEITEWNDYVTNLSHMYLDDNDDLFTISISGDLDKVVSFHNQAYDVFNTTSVDVSAFRNLRSAGFTFGKFTSLDLSKNRSLTSVDVSFNNLLTDVILPQKHNISYFDITGDQLPAAEVTSLIDLIHKNATKSRAMNGIIMLDAGGMSPSGEMVGPPSLKAVDKLRELRDNYGWVVIPDPDGAVIE